MVALDMTTLVRHSCIAWTSTPFCGRLYNKKAAYQIEHLSITNRTASRPQSQQTVSCLHLAEQSRWVEHFSQQRHMQDGLSKPWDKPGQYTFLGYCCALQDENSDPSSKGISDLTLHACELATATWKQIDTHGFISFDHLQALLLHKTTLLAVGWSAEPTGASTDCYMQVIRGSL